MPEQGNRIMPGPMENMRFNFQTRTRFSFDFGAFTYKFATQTEFPLISRGDTKSLTFLSI